MIADVLASLQGSAFAASLRGSTGLYPLVNAGHIVGIALLFGAIVPLDLRLIGLWRRMPLDSLGRVLVPTAATGFAIAAMAGALLFIAKATDYAASPVFQVKMIFLAAALANVVGLAIIGRVHRTRADPTTPLPSQRVLGAVSLVFWLSVIVLGRLIGYF